MGSLLFTPSIKGENWKSGGILNPSRFSSVDFQCIFCWVHFAGFLHNDTPFIFIYNMALAFLAQIIHCDKKTLQKQIYVYIFGQQNIDIDTFPWSFLSCFWVNKFNFYQNSKINWITFVTSTFVHNWYLNSELSYITFKFLSIVGNQKRRQWWFIWRKWLLEIWWSNKSDHSCRFKVQSVLNRLNPSLIITSRVCGKVIWFWQRKQSLDYRLQLNLIINLTNQLLFCVEHLWILEMANVIKPIEKQSVRNQCLAASVGNLENLSYWIIIKMNQNYRFWLYLWIWQWFS